MKNIILDEKYLLELIDENDDYVDYNIIYNHQKIGILQLRVFSEVFIRQIHIESQFRKQGHATNIVDFLVKNFNKSISLCVSGHSETAVTFWENYLKKYTNVENPKANVFRINKEELS